MGATCPHLWAALVMLLTSIMKPWGNLFQSFSVWHWCPSSESHDSWTDGAHPLYPRFHQYSSQLWKTTLQVLEKLLVEMHAEFYLRTCIFPNLLSKCWSLAYVEEEVSSPFPGLACYLGEASGSCFIHIYSYWMPETLASGVNFVFNTHLFLSEWPRVAGVFHSFLSFWSPHLLIFRTNCFSDLLQY